MSKQRAAAVKDVRFVERTLEAEKNLHLRRIPKDRQLEVFAGPQAELMLVAVAAPVHWERVHTYVLLAAEVAMVAESS